MDVLNKDTLKQYVLIALIVVLGYVVGVQLYVFFPGILGAVTMYILMRQYFFKLTVIKNRKKWVVATIFIITSILIFVLPLVFLIQILLPRFTSFLANTGQLNTILNTLTVRLQSVFPQIKINDEQIMGLLQRLTNSAPVVLGATADMLVNAILAFFLLYYMLVDGRKMEYSIQKYLPLKDQNVDDIWQATRVVVFANAIGIPVLAACQAAVAALGYYFFGVDSYILWGVITGICSLVPVVGVGIVWIPLCIYLFATGQTTQGIGLLLYSVIITSTIDNVLRFTLLKRLGDVHPIITALGILVGVPLFGFMGLIFGPLLIAYLLLLVRIYRIEFSNNGS